MWQEAYWPSWRDLDHRHTSTAGAEHLGRTTRLLNEVLPGADDHYMADDPTTRSSEGERSAPANEDRCALNAVTRILDAASVPTASLDGEGQIVALNPAFAAVCGRAPSEIAGLHLLALCPGREQAEVLSKLVRIVGGVSEIEQEVLRVTSADGHVKTLSVTLGGLTGKDGRVERVLAVASDLTEERRAQRRRRRAAVVEAQDAVADQQTGLPNHRALGVLIGSAVRRAGAHDAPFALLRCEVVNLDRLDSQHGPAVARSAMTALSERLTQRLRGADTVTRSDNGSFTVLAEDLGDAQDAAGVAYRLLAAVVEPIAVGGEAVDVEIVIGIAVGDGASAPDVVLADAESAARAARADGVGGFRMIDTRAASPA